MFISSSPRLILGEIHHRLCKSRPSRGAFMRRREGGAGPAPAGVVRSCTPGADPGATPPATKGWPWSGHRGTRKREKPVARWTGAFLLLASALARHTPSLLGEWEKRRANPKPDQPGGEIVWLFVNLDTFKRAQFAQTGPRTPWPSPRAAGRGQPSEVRRVRGNLATGVAINGPSPGSNLRCSPPSAPFGGRGSPSSRHPPRKRSHDTPRLAKAKETGGGRCGTRAMAHASPGTSLGFGFVHSV